MKSNILVLLFSLIFSLSAFSQTTSGCENLPPDFLGCENPPSVTFDFDEEGRVLASIWDVNTGLVKILVKDGSNVVEIPRNVGPRSLKLADGNVLLNERYYDDIEFKTHDRVVILIRDALGNYLQDEQPLFPDIAGIRSSGIGTYSTSYSYDSLSYTDGYAYVKRTKIMQMNCDPMDMDCQMMPPLVEAVFLRTSLDDRVVEVVPSIPEDPTTLSRYWTSFIGNDLYRMDTAAENVFRLWIPSLVPNAITFSEIRAGLEKVYLIYKEADGTTTVFAADLTEVEAKPVKILVHNLTGFIDLIDYEGNLDTGFEIRLGQTNLTKDISGHVFSNDKEIIIEIDKTKADFTVGTSLKIEMLKKGKEELAEPAITYFATQDDFNRKQIIYGFKPYSIGEVELVLTIGGNKKSKKYSIEVRDIAEKRVLVTRINPPTCNNTLCFNPVSDGELSNYLQFALPFTHKIFPFDSNGQGNLKFITSLPPVQGQYDFLEDLKKVWIQMKSVQAHRAVIIVDPAYFGLMDLANQLNISYMVYGVNLGNKSLSLVSINSPFSTLAHELAHSFYVEHSSNEGTDVPREGYSKTVLSGFDYSSKSDIPGPYMDFMWSFYDERAPGEWIHRLIYRDLVYGLGRPDNWFDYPQETKSLLIAAKLRSNFAIENLNISESESTWVNSSDSNGDISVVGLNKQNEILYETRIKADFNVSARFIDEPSAQNVLTSEYFPLLVSIPKIQGIEKVQIVHENQIIFEKEILRNLTLIQAIGLLPEHSFLKHSLQSRDKLLRIANEVLDNIQRNRKDKALNLLDKLLAESNKLIKTSYQTQGEEVGHDEFYATIEKYKRMLE